MGPLTAEEYSLLSEFSYIPPRLGTIPYESKNIIEVFEEAFR